MTGFDNGPARGDYVRYIDDLMKRAALAAPAVVSSDGDMASDVDALIRERTAASTGIATTPGEWMPTSPTVSRRARSSASPASGFATPVAASPAAATASTIAAALMSGQVGRRAMLPAATVIALVAIVIGALLIVGGALWPPFNLAPVVGGIVLITWAVRRIKAASIAARSTRSI